RNDEGEHHAGARLLRRLGGEHEDAGADDRADTQHGELEGTQRALERLLFRGRKNSVERLDAAEKHVDPLRSADPLPAFLSSASLPANASHASPRSLFGRSSAM